MEKITIYDVAKRAGVGIGTVSRVLNTPERAAPDTRERVLSAIDELGFVPKVEARTRARKLLGRIGILTPFLTSASFVELINSIRVRLNGHPFELVIYDAANAAQRDQVLMNAALSSTVDGLIVIHLPLSDKAVGRLEASKLSLVQLTDPDDRNGDAFSSIVIERQTTVGRMAAEHLLARGHRRIGFVGDKGVPEFVRDAASAKLDGFRQQLAEAGVPLPDAYVGRDLFGSGPAREQARRLLDLPQPPTAIFAASDTEAIGVLSAARERGLTVPDDLAVMGCDNIEIAEFLGLTTIDTNIKQRGQTAVELLLEQIADPSAAKRRVEMPAWIEQRVTA